MTPLFSKPGTHRVLVGKSAMMGAQGFLKKTFHCIKGTEPKFNQVWVAPETAITAAAVDAGDKGTPGNRNSIKDDFVPDLEFPKE